MADTQSTQKITSSNQISAWVKQNRARLQALTLTMALGAPFGLYWALQWGRDGAAVVFFSITVAGLIVVIIAG